MLEHLSEALAERYRARTLAPAEKLAVARHLAACAACRERVNQTAQSLAAFAALRKNLRPRAREDLQHLDYETLEAYVDERADALDTEIVESHVELCADCATELQALRAFAVMMQQAETRKQAATPAPSLWERALAWMGLSSGGSALSVAGAAAAVALFVVLAAGVFIVYRASFSGASSRLAEVKSAAPFNAQFDPANKNRNRNTSLPNPAPVIAENQPPKLPPFVIELARARGAGEVYKIPPDRDRVMIRAVVTKEANKKYEGRLVRLDRSFIRLGIVNAATNGKVVYSLPTARLTSGDYTLKIYRVPGEGNEDDEVASIGLRISK